MSNIQAVGNQNTADIFIQAIVSFWWVQDNCKLKRSHAGQKYRGALEDRQVRHVHWNSHILKEKEQQQQQKHNFIILQANKLIQKYFHPV